MRFDSNNFLFILLYLFSKVIFPRDVTLILFYLEAPRHFYLRGPLTLVKGLNILDNSR